MDERKRVSEYEWGRAARMRCYREYVGLSREEMAAALRIAPRSYQRFENGQAAIPSGIWSLVDELLSRFDQEVAKLVGSAVDAPVRVMVWRGAREDRFPPAMWLRIVAQAMRQNPHIEPYFPEDSGEE